MAWRNGASVWQKVWVPGLVSGHVGIWKTSGKPWFGTRPSGWGGSGPVAWGSVSLGWDEAEPRGGRSGRGGGVGAGVFRVCKIIVKKCKKNVKKV